MWRRHSRRPRPEESGRSRLRVCATSSVAQNRNDLTVVRPYPFVFSKGTNQTVRPLRFAAYRTATVTPPWLATPPTVNTTGTAPLSPPGTTTFTCIRPAIRPGAPPA